MRTFCQHDRYAFGVWNEPAHLLGAVGRGRRKLKKSYEYEVRWAGAFSHPEHDTWLTRDQCALPLRTQECHRRFAMSWCFFFGACALLFCAVLLGYGQSYVSVAGKVPAL